ncbi:MAG: hypothetical protein DMG96_30380 [Acidobacteria bacterium]|nr:MAG: hypothetical protein DMG96_30380 [Acidobacteriota bacterium]
MPRKRKADVRSQDNEARKHELGNDPREVGAESAGQSGGTQRLSTDEDSDNESVEELSEAAQDIEAARVEGSEDAADHPERPVHTHNEYGRPDDLPPARISDRKKAS